VLAIIPDFFNRPPMMSPENRALVGLLLLAELTTALGIVGALGSLSYRALRRKLTWPGAASRLGAACINAALLVAVNDVLLFQSYVFY
jgi:hypothetical protein